MSVSPAIFEMIVEPGEVRKQSFYIINTENYPVPVRATLQRLSPVEEEIDSSLSESFNASSWIEVSDPSHILKGKEKRQLTATATIPETAEPGGHYATIMLEPLVPRASNESSGAKTAAQVGILVFITVKGEAVTEVSFKDRMVSSLHTSGHIPIDIAVANTGAIHVLPTAKVTIRDIFGHTKDELPLKPRIVLPNTTKHFPAKWKGPAIFGIYSAQADGTYGSAQSGIDNEKQYFVVARWLPLAFTFLPLFALTIFTFKTYKRWPRAYRAFMGKPAKPYRHVENEDASENGDY